MVFIFSLIFWLYLFSTSYVALGSWGFVPASAILIGFYLIGAKYRGRLQAVRDSNS